MYLFCLFSFLSCVVMMFSFIPCCFSWCATLLHFFLNGKTLVFPVLHFPGPPQALLHSLQDSRDAALLPPRGDRDIRRSCRRPANSLKQPPHFFRRDFHMQLLRYATGTHAPRDATLLSSVFVSVMRRSCSGRGNVSGGADERTHGQ